VLRATSGNTIHNIGATLPMETDKPRINSVVRELVAQVAPVIAQVALGVPVAQEALAGLVVRVAQEALAELVVRVAQEALAELVVPAVVEQEPAPVAVEQELAPVAAEQELAPVEAVLVPGHPRAQLGAPERTKSVTGARRRDLVPLLAAEDLAAVAGTTRVPAAAEAATAWEVADIAVVVAEDAAAEE
jgi:hypothetical protein